MTAQILLHILAIYTNI